MGDLRLGMIGLDTSHCLAFADILNLENHPHHVAGGKVQIAYPGGSQQFSLSRDRVGTLTAQLQEKHNLTIVSSIEEVAEASDAILLESVDGRQHLEQFAKIAPYKKPVFIDKPLATTVAEAKEILRLAKQHNTPVFSCSSLRYAEGIVGLEANHQVLGSVAFGPMSILPDFPGLFWYGIHIAEMLFAKMGTGCLEVKAVHNETADTIVGQWAEGRNGTVYGHRIPKQGQFGITLFTDSGVQHSPAKTTPPYYAMLLPQVIEFFNTGKSPIAELETLEIIAFLEAANQSLASGAPVKLSSLIGV